MRNLLCEEGSRLSSQPKLAPFAHSSVRATRAAHGRERDHCDCPHVCLVCPGCWGGSREAIRVVNPTFRKSRNVGHPAL